MVLHATTVATNAVLERKGAETGLITTEGFRDVLIIGRQKRYETYDLYIDKPKPLVRRRHIAEVAERVGADGSRGVASRRSLHRPRHRRDGRLQTPGDRRVAAACLCPPRARAAHSCQDRGAPARCLGLDLVRGLLEVPRVRAHQHDRRQCLREAARRPLPATISRAPCASGASTSSCSSCNRAGGWSRRRWRGSFLFASSSPDRQPAS